MTSRRAADLPDIAVCDVRESGLVAFARERRETVLALRTACLSVVPGPARGLLVVGDALARRWLARSQTPYAGEIAEIAAIVGARGAFLLNTSYEWGCTTRTADDPATGLPRLRRTLDWPFPGLGRHVAVVRQRGAAGEFWNVTWPGAVGVLTALAPGRFAVALNQAPLHRRTRGQAARAYDFSRHALRTFRHVLHMPPSHLLRHVVETAPDVTSAVDLLSHRPVARPVLYAVAGLAPGETWLIERTETTARVFHRPVTVANDWQAPHPDWEPRGTSRFDLRAENVARKRTLADCDARAGFDWVIAPVLNVRTRLAVEMNPSSGRLAVLGYEPGGQGAEPATRPLEMVVEAVAA